MEVGVANHHPALHRLGVGVNEEVKVQVGRRRAGRRCHALDVAVHAQHGVGWVVRVGGAEVVEAPDEFQKQWLGVDDGRAGLGQAEDDGVGLHVVGLDLALGG